MLLNNNLGVLAAVLILLVSACSSEGETPSQTAVSPPTTVIDEDMISDSETLTPVESSVTIGDYSDIIDLPTDTGGTHTAYPLQSTQAIFGHFVYTPSEYTEDGFEYPLLVFLHGWDPTGYTGTDEQELNELLLGTTPPALIESNNWNPSTPFIVASPRLKSKQYWDHNEIHSFIEYIVGKYPINSNRIYLTGLSLGGGGTWYYVGERGEDNYVTAIVPISARGEERIISNLTNIPIWAFHGDSDTTVPPFTNYGSLPLVNAINAQNPTTKAKVTIFNNTGHDAWSRVYSNNFISSVQGSPFNMSIYDWLLQYRKK